MTAPWSSPSGSFAAGIWRIFGAFLLFKMAEFGTWVAVLLHASADRAASVGIVGLFQPSPPPRRTTAAAPGDRFPRHRVLFGGYVIQAIATGLTALAMATGAPVVVVYAAAAFAAASVVVARPTQSATSPSLSQTPEELNPANGAAGVVEGTGVLLGPLIAALVLTVRCRPSCSPWPRSGSRSRRSSSWA